MIPRWRNSITAATTGELMPIERIERPQFAVADELHARAQDWRTHRSISFAADLISAGLVLDARDNEDVKDAVADILSRPNAPTSC